MSMGIFLWKVQTARVFIFYSKGIGGREWIFFVSPSPPFFIFKFKFLISYCARVYNIYTTPIYILFLTPVDYFPLSPTPPKPPNLKE